MPKRLAPATYNEPTVMWRMRHLKHGGAHAMITPSPLSTSAVWFLQGSPCGARNFPEWRHAILWLNAVRWELEADGWQLVDERAN